MRFWNRYFPTYVVVFKLQGRCDTLHRIIRCEIVQMKTMFPVWLKILQVLHYAKIKPIEEPFSKMVKHAVGASFNGHHLVLVDVWGNQQLLTKMVG